MAKPPHQKSSKIIDDALNLMKNGDIYTALHQLEEIKAKEMKNLAFCRAYAIVLHQAGRYSDSIVAFEQCMRLDPKTYSHSLNAGEIARLNGDYDKAEFYIRQSLKMTETALAYNNLGLVLATRNRPQEAIDAYKKAIQLEPDFMSPYYNAGVMLIGLEYFSDSLEYLKVAAELQPINFSVLQSLAICYDALLDYDASRELFIRIVTLNPDSQSAHFNLALAHLKKDDYQQGFAELSWRLNDHNNVPEIATAKPLWKGESLDGKTLLISHETQSISGFGDTLTFSRFIIPILEYQPKLLLVYPQKPLYSLLKLWVDGTDVAKKIDGVKVIDTLETAFFDYHIPIGELPRILQANIETIPEPITISLPKSSEETSLELPKEKSRELLDDGVDSAIKDERKRVAFFLQSSSKHIKSKDRSIKYGTFRPLLENSEIDYYLIQTDKMRTAYERDLLQEDLQQYKNLINLKEQITDFRSTAHILKKMDMLITVDSAVVHLAASLYINIDIVLLLPYNPDWRWTDKGSKAWYGKFIKNFDSTNENTIEHFDENSGVRLHIVRQDSSRKWQTVLPTVQSLIDRLLLVRA